MKDKINKFLLNFVIFLLFVIPQNYNFIFLFVLFIFIVSTSRLQNIYFSKILWLLLFFLIILYNNLSLNNNLAFQRLIIITFLFTFSPNNIALKNLNNSTLYLIFFYIVFFQLGVAFNFNFCINYINNFYPYTDLDFDPWDYGTLDSAKEFVDLRFGGIYRNPNVMAQNLILLFMFFLLKAKNNESNNKKIHTIFLLFMLPIIFSASRVSFFVYALTFLLLSSKRVVMWILSTFTFISLIFSSIFNNLRIFNFIDLVSGKGSSGYEKLSASALYFKSNPSFLNLLIGNIDGTKSFIFDNDIGEIIFNYGFIGLGIIIIFYFESYFSTIKKYKFFFIFLFYSFGMGIITSFKTVSALFIIFSLINKKKNNNKIVSDITSN